VIRSRSTGRPRAGVGFPPGAIGIRACGRRRALLRGVLHDPHDVWGGFAAIPAYLADLFGTAFVGAIHGRLLTAWSMAGVVGPVLVNDFNEQQVRAGVPRAAAFWLLVTLPLAWGLWATIRQAAVLCG